MDISELPDALSRLAQHLEQTDDEPFTLHSRDAVLMAMQVIAEHSEVGAAVDQALRLRYSPTGPAGELDLPLPVRLRRELVRGLHGCGVPSAERLLQPDDSAERQATPPRGDLLLRLAAHLLPTETSDEAEMDSPLVNLEQFGLGREDPETRILLEHMDLGSGDASWPAFPRAYVARGLSSYLTAVAKAQRRAVLLRPGVAEVDNLRRAEFSEHVRGIVDGLRQLLRAPQGMGDTIHGAIDLLELAERRSFDAPALPNAGPEPLDGVCLVMRVPLAGQDYPSIRAYFDSLFAAADAARMQAPAGSRLVLVLPHEVHELAHDTLQPTGDGREVPLLDLLRAAFPQLEIRCESPPASGRTPGGIPTWSALRNENERLRAEVKRGGPTERNPTRCTVCGGIPPAHKFDCRVRPGGQVGLPADYHQQPDRPHDRDVEVPRAPRTVYGKPPKCLRCAALGLGHTSPEQIALAVKALGPHTCEEGADRTDEPVKP